MPARPSPPDRALHGRALCPPASLPGDQAGCRTSRVAALSQAAVQSRWRGPAIEQIRQRVTEPVEVLREGPSTLPGATLPQFQSAAQSTRGVIDTLVSAVRNAAEDLQGQVRNWQSDRINVLTIVTMSVLPISFLTDWVGMKFSWLDNQRNSLASGFLLGVALPVGLVVGRLALLPPSGYKVPRLLRRHQPRDPG